MQCFDLAADPAEQVDLAAPRPEEGARVREALLRRAHLERVDSLSSESADRSDRIHDALRGLGYVK